MPCLRLLNKCFVVLSLCDHAALFRSTVLVTIVCWIHGSDGAYKFFDEERLMHLQGATIGSGHAACAQ
jgi:hypothetical protein